MSGIINKEFLICEGTIMKYEVFMQDPSAYIPVLIWSILLTALIYGVFPFWYSRIRNKPISRKRYSVYCYLFNFLIKIVTLFIQYDINMAPYMIWTSIFCYFGYKKLVLRGMITDSAKANATNINSDANESNSSIEENIVTSENEDTEGLNNELSSAELVKTIIDIQAKETVRVYEANKHEQPNDENDADFGLVPEKPIYTLATKLVEGEQEYLDQLYNEKGEKVKWLRKGSISVNNINGMIDIYDMYLPSGEFYKTIYINMYGARLSNSVPRGFKTKKEIQENKKIKYCSKCGSLIDNITKQCTGCKKQYFKVIKFKKSYVILVFLILLLLTINVIVTVTNNRLNENNIDLNQHIDKQIEKIELLEQKNKNLLAEVEILEREIANNKSTIGRLNKQSLDNKIKAGHFTDIVNGTRYGNIGYAASNFFASDSVIVVSKGEFNKKFNLTAYWSNGGSVIVSYSSDAAKVSFDNESWSKSTEMTVIPREVGVTVVTFSNNVDSKSFKILIVVED